MHTPFGVLALASTPFTFYSPAVEFVFGEPVLDIDAVTLTVAQVLSVYHELVMSSASPGVRVVPIALALEPEKHSRATEELLEGADDGTLATSLQETDEDLHLEAVTRWVETG
eukprot:CAMPEP_0175904454 /NCGR_PEP_ID=MMETSP0108-20121206/4483_1 /TAXON_ID=195067 ORGANISM="Goniomonas pacifica, Strain CCMP1869" /NCGR_SAMPLE_ID=MMETSP0108 /ASSEMBLY_ACC=CAM_ASM_000204 /LENGTH=112 /DNA_ID=CAMNT_0017226263 /DNA_START=16 /DNA_END=350 /DNA_ORIENTATION=+